MLNKLGKLGRKSAEFAEFRRHLIFQEVKKPPKTMKSAEFAEFKAFSLILSGEVFYKYGFPTRLLTKGGKLGKLGTV